MIANQDHHTLIALCGTSPAVLTETIWALADEAIKQADPTLIPDKVIVLTTTTGKLSLQQQLLSPTNSSPTIWQQLREALEKQGINLSNKLKFGDTSEHIRCFSTDCPESGLAKPLDDLRSKQDQEAAADYMLETLRALTETPGEQLTISIAGGRKSMSALFYGAMTLVGREQDRITHVLVSPPYDSPLLTPKFYFPAQLNQELTEKQPSGKQIVKAHQAEIELANIPFVPLRYAFKEHFQSAAPSFRSLAAHYTHQSLVNKTVPLLEINQSAGVVTLATETLPLSPTEFLILLFFALHCTNQAPAYLDYAEAVEDLESLRKKLRVSGQQSCTALWRKKIDSPISDADALNKKLSSLRNKLKKLKMYNNNGATLARCLPKKGQCKLNYPLDQLLLT